MLSKRPLGVISKFILLINVIAIVFLLLSYLAPFVKPQTFWPIAFLGIAYPFFLIINIVFILFWLFRKSSMALIPLFAILIGWNALNKNFGFNGNQDELVEKDSSAIRMMSYNIQMFNNSDEKGVDNKQEILEVIKEVSPDVLCIQEYYTRKKGKSNIGKNFINEVGLKYSFFTPVAQNDYDAYGIVIFSKYPIEKSGTLDINTNERIVNRIIYADINRNGKIFRVYNVHLQSIGFQPEDYNFIKEDAPVGNVDMKSTKRIGRRLKAAYIKRNDQVDLLYEHTRNVTVPYVVAGDFNDTPLSYSVNRISENMLNAFVERGKGFGITYNGAFPNFQIDYILASKQFQIQNFQILKKKFSDHYPIWSDIRL